MTVDKAKRPADYAKGIIQVGIVVEDLDSAVQGMREVFDMEPDLIRDMDYPTVEYRGEETAGRVRVAMLNQFGVQLEFMQPIGEGDSVWRDHLKDGKPASGLHHIRFSDVDDNDVFSQAMASRGVEVLQEGASIVNPGAKFTYYDTADRFGFITEVVTKASK